MFGLEVQINEVRLFDNYCSCIHAKSAFIYSYPCIIVYKLVCVLLGVKYWFVK